MTVVGIALPFAGRAGYERYFAAVERADARAVPLYGTGADLEGVDALLLPGGGDLAYREGRYFGGARELLQNVDPERDERDLALARLAFERRLRVLGICRGMQVFSCALGGKLYEDIGLGLGLSPGAERHQKLGEQDAEHAVRVRAGSLLHGWFGAYIPVNSAHHQAVSAPGAGLIAAARSPGGVLEALEHQNGRALLVQWHPERMPGMEPLFCWLAAPSGGGKAHEWIH